MRRTRLRRRSHRRHAPMAILAVTAILLAGCGARLTKAQMSALDGSGGSASGGGGQTAVGTGPSTGGSSAGSAPTQSGGTLASGGPTQVATGGVSSSGHGATGPSTGPSAGAATSGGSSGASATAIAPASDPLAGVGGKVCTPSAQSTDPGVTSSSITVGNIATVNGPVPGLFAGARYGAEAVAAYINSIGGICGRRLVVDSQDDQFDQNTDQQEASTMASQVLAFMGSFSLQDAGITDGAPNVPDIGEALSSTRFNSATNFSPEPEPPGYHIGEYEYMKSDPRYAQATQHMALLVENTPQTATTGKWEAAALQSVGFKFVFTDTTLQPTDPTFNGDVQKMKAAGVQGVIFQATGTIIGQLANAMYAAGMKVVLGNYSPPAYDPAYLKNAGPGAAGTVLSQPMALYDGEDANQIPMVATLDQWYARVNPGQVPDIYAVYSWMSGLLLAQAINTGGAPTRAAITAGLKQLTSFTAGGLQSAANPAAKTPPSCWVLIDVQNGKFVRDSATPTGFKCSPAGYFRYPGS
jgi:ABC-type branched-subunit amino acid transport system substrate-binding protein